MLDSPLPMAPDVNRKGKREKGTKWKTRDGRAYVRDVLKCHIIGGNMFNWYKTVGHLLGFAGPLNVPVEAFLHLSLTTGASAARKARV